MNYCAICSKSVDNSDGKHPMIDGLLYCYVGTDFEVHDLPEHTTNCPDPCVHDTGLEPVNENDSPVVTDETDPVALVEQRIAELAKSMESVAEQANELSNAEKQINDMIAAERAAFEERVAKLKGELMQMHETKWDIQRELRKSREALESAQHEKEQIERAKIAQQQFESLTARWDKMVMGAPWREWAKDHQVVGAKKMVYAGKMILADTMGLGKTLTSLIALDLIEAMTKEASYDHPLVIDVP